MKELVKNRPGAKQVVTGFTPDSQVAERPHQGPDPGGTSSETGTIGGATSPLVSVIIPAYNAERYIARTLESVLSQTYEHIEVLVVNDGSNDGTGQIIKSFCLRDPRVILIEQVHSGAAAARNHAIEKAKGEFIAPIDADDIWYRDKLKEQVDCILRSGRSVGLVYTWSMIIGEKEDPIAVIAHNCEGDVLADLIYTNFIGNGSSPLIRRACFDSVGGYDLQLKDRCEDWDIYLRIAEKYEFRVVPKLHVAYRRLPNGLSSDYGRMEESFSLLLRNLQLRHPEIPRSMLKLSESCFYLYLVGKSNSKGHYWDSLILFLRSLQLDPMRFFSPEFHLAYLKWLLRVATTLFTPRVRRHPHTWRQARQHPRNIATREPIILQGGESTPDNMFPRRIYDWIHNRRMDRMRKKIRALQQIGPCEAVKTERISPGENGRKSGVV
jgi:glycosyltransferase involved in cell wall biosynthesis